jgi:hexosaminidase
MLDTSRRFFEVATIKDTLDVLAAAKFNVFHWHAVDDDSFPLTLQSYPSVSSNGAFTAAEVYSKENVKEIVDYATSLGIRVVPEFDNPGHVRAVGFDPHFKEAVRCFNRDLPNNVPNAYKINGGPPTGVLDPSYNITYDLLQGIFNDFKTYFPDDMIHLGGDEVMQSCFNENPNL